MRLPSFLDFPEINALRNQMGAPLCASLRIARSARLSLDERLARELETEGVDVAIEDLEILPDSTLSYKGRRVLLYIRDVSYYTKDRGLPKFHLSYCRTLESMHRQRRFERYVVATRSDGKFQVNVSDKLTSSSKSSLEPLDVCQNCLAGISWHGFRPESDYAERSKRVREFEIAEFFRVYPRDLIASIPQHTADTAPLNEYPADWGIISQQAKASAHYSCCRCGFLARAAEYEFLHVHHVNGLKNDNRSENLLVICVGCHAEEPGHGHMKALPNYSEFITKFGPRGTPRRPY